MRATINLDHFLIVKVIKKFFIDLSFGKKNIIKTGNIRLIEEFG